MKFFTVSIFCVIAILLAVNIIQAFNKFPTISLQKQLFMQIPLICIVFLFFFLIVFSFELLLQLDMASSAPIQITVPFFDRFTSMEITQSPPTRSLRQEVRPLIGLLMDIIDTVQTSAKADIKRANLKTSLSVTQNMSLVVFSHSIYFQCLVSIKR